MGNTLTGLIPTLYESLDIVSREMVGFLSAVGRDSNAEQAAVGQTVRVGVAPTATEQDNTPGVTAPDNGDQTITFVDMTISKSKSVPIRWTGEEQRSLAAGGQRAALVTNQFTQAMRRLCNLVERDVAIEAYKRASRAYGTAGTTPFATDLSELANMLKILQDNGAPTSDLQCVIDTTSGAKLRTLGLITKANEAGTDAPLRQGVLLDIFGFALRESSQIKAVTKGAGAGYLVNNAAGYSEGATAIAVDTGTGAINQGDIVTFNGDTNKYVVESLSGGVLTLAAPGLRKAVADDAAITVGNNFTPNICFDRQSIQVATRAPAMPEEGDMADDVIEIVDPVSALAFQVAMYRQYRQVKFEVGLAWGVRGIKTEHNAILLG